MFFDQTSYAYYIPTSYLSLIILQPTYLLTYMYYLRIHPLIYIHTTYLPTHLPTCNTYLPTHPPIYIHTTHLPTYLLQPTYLYTS